MKKMKAQKIHHGDSVTESFRSALKKELSVPPNYSKI
jgi:hypothetical protein